MHNLKMKNYMSHVIILFFFFFFLLLCRDSGSAGQMHSFYFND